MNLGSRQIGAMEYDKITAFTVDLEDYLDRKSVADRIAEFIQSVERVTV